MEVSKDEKPSDPHRKHSIISPKNSRPLLHAQAVCWRFLMGIGMYLHKVAPPRPPSPSFERVIPTAVSPNRGTVRIQFYVPRNYRNRMQLGGKRFPCLVNFHGGGFTLGTATDDARWSGTVVERVGAVVASVDYRLAPEYVFPTAVEDGVDAILYIAKHADSLYIDRDMIGVSGFSSGGNMSFTVPLRLQEEINPDYEHSEATAHLRTGSIAEISSNKTGHLADGTSIVRMIQDIKIAVVVAWYPSTDYTVTRAQRRATNTVRKDQELSAIFTELFDESYLQPPSMDMSNPYLSPGVAPLNMLGSLPDDILLYTCEWDMLKAEAERFKTRLEGLGKRVRYTMVPGVPHGFDKAPNPISVSPGVRELYHDACKELIRIFKVGQ